jgi:methyltransferase (TIGR00027 family)
MKSGQASMTAQRVAAQRVTFDRIEVPFGSPDGDDRLASDVADGVDGPFSDHMSRYLRARTRFFDSAVVSAITDGVTQIVVAGAGYDGRALRYSKPGVAWFEVDHPDTQADKRRRLDILGIPTHRISFVAADFNDSHLGLLLAAGGHDRTVPTLFLCEGVAVYLERPVLESLMRSLRSAAAPRSQLAISVSLTPTSAGFVERRRRFNEAVTAMGEPPRSQLTADDIEPLLWRAGWQIVPSADDPGNDSPADPANGSPDRRRLAGLVLAESA